MAVVEAAGEVVEAEAGHASEGAEDEEEAAAVLFDDLSFPI